MKCPECGVDNPEGMSFCGACGKPLETPSVVPSPVRERYCVGCGRVIPWDVNVCQYCGHDYRAKPKEPVKQQSDWLLVGSILTVLAGIISILLLTLVYIDYGDMGTREVMLAVMLYAFATMAILGGIAGLARTSFTIAVLGAACGIVGPAFFFGIPGLVLIAQSMHRFEKR